MVSDKLEIWYQPTGGPHHRPRFLESRHYSSGDEVPTTYDMGNGVVLLAAHTDTFMGAAGAVLRVRMIEPDYADQPSP